MVASLGLLFATYTLTGAGPVMGETKILVTQDDLTDHEESSNPHSGSLGTPTTGRALAFGTHTVTTAEAGATVPTVTIATGLTTILAFVVQSRTSGANLELSALDVVASGANLVITNSATTSQFMAAGDVIHWIAGGT